MARECNACEVVNGIIAILLSYDQLRRRWMTQRRSVTLLAGTWILAREFGRADDDAICAVHVSQASGINSVEQLGSPILCVCEWRFILCSESGRMVGHIRGWSGLATPTLYHSLGSDSLLSPFFRLFGTADIVGRRFTSTKRVHQWTKGRRRLSACCTAPRAPLGPVAARHSLGITPEAFTPELRTRGCMLCKSQ